MSNSINERIARLQARMKREGRQPPDSRREFLEAQAVRRDEADARARARTERDAARLAAENAAWARWHKRHYMMTRNWHLDAYRYVTKTPTLERRLRAQGNAKRPRVGTGRKLRYTD